MSKHILTVRYTDEDMSGGKGYRGTCSCGWESTLCGYVRDIGEEYDEHRGIEIE